MSSDRSSACCSARSSRAALSAPISVSGEVDQPGAIDERDAAVKKLLSMAISAAKAKGKYIGICGQGPSDHPDLAVWLMEQGIESVSLNPDTVVNTWLQLAKSKARGD